MHVYIYTSEQFSGTSNVYCWLWEKAGVPWENSQIQKNKESLRRVEFETRTSLFFGNYILYW